MALGKSSAMMMKAKPDLIRVVVITVSDRSSRGQRPDQSGPVIQHAILDLGWRLVDSQIISDDLEQIASVLNYWIEQKADLILTVGGTGFSPRDNTPEATLKVVDRLAPGIAEGMRQASMKITPHAMLSRAVAGIKDATLIINLPGSPKAALENFSAIQAIIPHAVDILRNASSAELGHATI